MEENTKYELRKGLLVVAVLSIIRKKRTYAAEILTELQKTVFATQEGTLYPLLSKLKRDGLLIHEWKESKNGPPRKYFILSNEGKKRLNELMLYMNEIERDIAKLRGGEDE